MTKNPFDIVASPLEGESVNNPFNSLEGKNLSGVKMPDMGQTNFSKIQTAKKETKKLVEESKKANSFTSIALQTLNPINLATSAYKIVKSAVTNPVESAKQAALGFANGVTLGATDYLQRKAFIDAATKGGLDEKQAQQLADSTLQPEDNALKSIRGGADFAAMVVPYAGLESAFIKGAAYASPKFVKQYAYAAKVLVDIGAFNAAGQINETFLPEDERNRFQRAVMDTGTAIGFNLLGSAYRRVRGTAFKSPFEISPITNVNSLVEQGVVVTGESLQKGARARIKELEGKSFLRGNEPKELKFLKDNIDNPDKLYAFNSNPPKADFPVPDAKTSVTIKTGEINEKTGEPTGPEIRVATNDLPALQNYIRGSGDISYKVVENLGKDSKGNPIQARHEFVNGEHIIYATDGTTASNLAHELGHYFDVKLTKTTEKLSTLIAGFEKNREKVEYLLGSLAVDRLGGTATAEQISKEVARMVKLLQGEVDVLSSTRRGKLISSKSERFADAVSQVAVENSAKEQAPILSALLKQAERFKEEKLFGDGAKVKDLALTSDTAKDTMVTVRGEGFTMTGKAADGVKVAVADYKAKVKESYGVETKAAKKKLIADKQKVIENAVPGEMKPVKTKAPKLDRQPTGKKPKTEAFKANLITNDADTEVFINKNFLSKATGKERIGRSNEDIRNAAKLSDMTEGDFNKILYERLGNLSGLVVKAKQILTDGANNLRNKLAGREISELSGQELKDVMGDYSRLLETFEVFAGVRTELSNSFRSLGIGVNPGENDVLVTALETIQKAIGGETNPFKIAQKVYKLQEKTAVSKYFEIWYPALLSGPKTTARNLTGNASNLTLQTIARLYTEQGRKEFFPMVEAMINGQKEAINKALSVLKGESVIYSKINEPSVPRSETFKGKFAFLNKVEYVGRFYNAQDSYFSSLARDAEVAAQRTGDFTYGLKNEDAYNAVNEAVGNAFARNVTFRNQYEKTFISEAASKISSLKSSENEYTRVFANMFTPFVRTVANITDRRIDFVPILNLSRTFDSLGAKKIFEQRANRIVKEASLFNKIFDDAISKDMTAKEAREVAESEVERVKEIVISRLKNQQMGRFYMGMSVLAAGVPLAVTGRMTGSGPANKNERDTLIASGWRPNSIIMPNGVALPYQNLALPLASIFSILGNISDAHKYKQNGSLTKDVLSGFGGFLRSELDQSFLSGLANLYDGATGYTPVETVLSNIAASAIPIPAAWSQTKDVFYPERYVAKDFNSIIKNKLGITGDFFGTGLTEPLQPNLDVFGNQKKADLIYGLTPPLLNSKTDDPVLNFMLENNISFGKPNMGNKITGRGDQPDRVLTPQEYTDYVKNSGSKIYDELKSKIDSGYFDRFKTQEEKKKAMNAIVRKIRLSEKDKIKY